MDEDPNDKPYSIYSQPVSRIGVQLNTMHPKLAISLP